MKAAPAVILGCGYTGRRVAARLAARGIRVTATTRHPEALAIPGVTTIRFDALESLSPLDCVEAGASVVYSIPGLSPEPIRDIVVALGNRPSRVIYLSTTGVYGAETEVDEHTRAAPNNHEGEARLEAERAIVSGPWSSLVLRPAAIYGPDRGVHVRMVKGTFRLGGDGSNYVSRIHVHDLAAHVEAALFSNAEGAWPVADECPATSREVAQYCSELLNVPMPESVAAEELPTARRSNRRVNGSCIRRLLGISLEYPSYREGILAAVTNAEGGVLA